MIATESLLDDQPGEAAAVFDAMAARYDDVWTDSVIGSLQREAVWRELDGLFRPGERILDLGCGTGVDAARLARAGARVRALDISTEMVRASRRRVEAQGLCRHVICERRALEQLGELGEKGPFDGAVSNFGALNCVADLRRLAQDLALLLRPGAWLALCYMGRFCLWETAWYLLRAQPRKALRRISERAGTGPAPTGTFQVLYPAMREVVRAFGEDFRLVKARGVGVFVPPSYAEALARRAPGFVRGCARLDRIAGGWPLLRAIADHRLLILVRK